MTTKIDVCTCQKVDELNKISYEEILQGITNKEKIVEVALSMILLVGTTVGAVFLGSFLSSLIPFSYLGWALAAGAFFVTIGATTQTMHRYLIERVQKRIIANEQKNPEEQNKRITERKKTNECPITQHNPTAPPQNTLPPIQE